MLGGEQKTPTHQGAALPDKSATAQEEKVHQRNNVPTFVPIIAAALILVVGAFFLFSGGRGNKEKGGTASGYKYVDLGLSVKWATCNIGATKPEKCGDYYAWGEVTPKGVYDIQTYKW